MRQGWRPPSMRGGSTGIRSCAVNRDPARHTRWVSCSSGCWLARVCVWSSSIPTPTTSVCWRSEIVPTLPSPRSGPPPLLWRNRARRQPCLIVIDEAHNVCPRQPADTVTALATNYASLIAAEGRKFGLYLLTSTQRPQKVHDEVLSQCDNLLLMRMNLRPIWATSAILSRSFRTASCKGPRLSAKARAWWLASSSPPGVRAVRSATVAGRRLRHTNLMGCRAVTRLKPPGR